MERRMDTMEMEMEMEMETTLQDPTQPHHDDNVRGLLSARNTRETNNGRTEERREMERRMDTEMETETTPQGPTQPHHDDNVRGLLSLARQLIAQGKPSLALQAVVTAMRSNGGEAAIFQTLHRARQLYQNRLQANAAAEELASLFAECAIAEARPDKSETLPFDSGGSSMVPDTDGSSILAQTGRKQVVLDAFADGSSFICLQCGGLVSNHRREEHSAYWCCKI